MSLDANMLPQAAPKSASKPKSPEEQRLAWRESKRRLRQKNGARSEAQRAADVRYYQRNKETRLEKSREWRRKNPDKQREYDRRQHIKNPARYRAKAAVYRAQIKGPADPRVRAFYVVCDWLRARGDDVSVDHIYPLSRGGPHVFWNLRIIPRSDNCRKHATAPTKEQAEICLIWKKASPRRQSQKPSPSE